MIISSSSVRRHWTQPRSFSLHSVHSQHPLYSPSSSFCCTIRSDRYTQPWPFLPYWNLDQTHYHRWTAHLHSTHWSVLPVMAPTRSRLLAVAQLSLSANLSHSYPPLFKIFRRSSHILSLCNFLIQSYQSSISIVLHLRPLILNHSVSSLMTSVLFSPPQQPHAPWIYHHRWL